MNETTTRLLLLGGIAGPVLFVGVFLVDGALRAGYDPMRMFVSGLLLGDGGWVETVSFVLSGTLVVAFAVGLRRTLAVGPAARAAPAAVAVVGLGLIVAGLFVGDPGMGYPPGAPEGLAGEMSWNASLHYLGAVMIFFVLPLAAFLLARRAWRSGDRALAAYSTVSGVAVMGLYLAAVLMANAGSPAADFAGLAQRLAIVSGFGWLAVTAVLLLAGRPSLLPAGSAGEA